jgi:hypothetical protein
VAFWLHGAREPGGGDVVGKAAWLIPAFFTGVWFHLARDRIPLHAPLALVALATLLVTGALSPMAFALVDIPCLGYLVLYVAYAVPAARRFLHADYSYGLYLYAFLVQQSLALLVPGISVMAMTAGATIISVMLAAASWHLVERRATALVDLLVQRMRLARRGPVRQGFAPSMSFPSRLDAEG